MIVHDLRNPLAAISGKIELFLIKNQSLAETQRAEIKSCLACCDDLSDMIQGLLDVHKMEENKLRLNKKLMNPAVIIEEVIGQLSQKAEAKQQALFSTLSEDSLNLEIDRGLIKRVISNLIANAIRHTPAGGEIEVFIEPFLQNKSVCVGVRDSGDGLAFEYHQKIFERFEQAALKRAGVKTGSCGLGLSVLQDGGGGTWRGDLGGERG